MRDKRTSSSDGEGMSPAERDQAPAAEIRVIDPGTPHLVLLWQAHDGHGHQASGQLAGAPPTPEVASWRYQTFTEAAQAAIAALQALEGLKTTIPEPAPSDPATAGSSKRRSVCDFCAEQPAAWRYPTHRDGIISVGGAVVVLPGGDWLACPACYQLVEAGLWATLSVRAGLSAEHGAVLWAYFRESRGGPAVPLDAPQGGEIQ
jgi:hypothetical protein